MKELGAVTRVELLLFCSVSLCYLRGYLDLVIDRCHGVTSYFNLS